MLKISAIYIIRNLVNNHFYLGSTVNFNKRKKSHYNSLLKNKHHCRYLQNAFNKYGENNFVFEIIHFCEKNDTLKLEGHYLELLKPNYNTSLDAIAPMKGRRHTNATKDRMSKQRQGNTHSLGFKHSLENRQKRSEFTKGRKHSAETKLKMSETSKRLNRVQDLNKIREKMMKAVVDSQGNNFKSMASAARFWNISVQTVCDILKGRHSKTRKGIGFKYVE